MPKIDILMEGFSLGTDVGIIGFCSVILVEGEKRVLFDSAHVGRRTYLQAQLAARGLSPSDIDFQVLSHAHWDHIQNCDVFDQAPMIVHPDERKYAQHPHRNDWATPQWTGAVLETMKLVEAGDGYEIMPGCRVVELIGHTPGSIGLEVETDNGLCILTGDAVHNSIVARLGKSPLVFWDAAKADASIKRCVDSGAIIYPGHDRPFRLKGDEVDYLTPLKVTINGVEPGMDGVSFTGRPSFITQWIMPGIEQQRLD